MTQGEDPAHADVLTWHEGRPLLSGAEVVLKSLLEADTAVTTLIGPRLGPFADLYRAAAKPGRPDVLRRHDLAVQRVPTGARAVDLAMRLAASGQGAAAFVPNRALDTALTRLAAAPALGRGGAALLLLEHDPAAAPRVSPLAGVRQHDVTALEPADLDDLRSAVEAALRLSQASAQPVAVIVHALLLRRSGTFDVRANRVMTSVDAMLARRRRRRRALEPGDTIRMIRRLELNTVTALPSPGERASVGFIATGPALNALRHLTYVLRLAGRVPTLQLRVVHPVDETVTARFLTRCHEVIVLESRPGEVGARVLEIAEAVRHEDERPALVWGRTLPPDDTGAAPLGLDEAAHPSRLARRIVRSLHLIGPAEGVANKLVPAPDLAPDSVPPRSSAVGSRAALLALRQIIAETNEWLASRITDETEQPETPTVLAVDGVWPDPAPEPGTRVVMVESWDAGTFTPFGLAAVRQAARDERPWLLLVFDDASEHAQDLERLVRGVIPADRADRVHLERATISATPHLRELMQTAVREDRVTVIIVRDGEPARFDVAAIDRELREVDQLGFEPHERVVLPVDTACAVRPPTEAIDSARRTGHDRAALRQEVRVDRVRRRTPGRVRFRVRPIWEQVEVWRTRPPVGRWSRTSARSGLPVAVHRDAAWWRVHLAGSRGETPGYAARILMEAGRSMGYAVHAVHDPRPVGAGRRAGAQVTFTHPRPGEEAPPISVQIPFGEADLLLGLDTPETIRALGVDPRLRVAAAARTYAVVNRGRFRDEPDPETPGSIGAALDEALRDTTHAHPRIVGDFATACRLWFDTDRVVDTALLGAAFQAGLIPVTIDAMEAALTAIEAEGAGRARAAFRFGRDLAEDPRLFSRPRDDPDANVDRLVRRTTRFLARGRGGSARADAFRHLVANGVTDMPGLAETDTGRQARRDFVVAIDRCAHWGGLEYAQMYARIVTDLYRADRGDTGRALTRHAILPLAGAMLIRDSLYVARMATSPEQQRRTRLALNARRARGDRVERRLLMRFEAEAFRRRIRVDTPAGPGPARLIAAARRIVPHRWRGSRRERDLRAYVIDLIERATRESEDAYAWYQAALFRLHGAAVENRLRLLTPAQGRELAEPDDVEQNEFEEAPG